MEKDIWRPILREMGFPEDRDEDLLRYIQTHMEYEKMSTIPLFSTTHLEEVPTLVPALRVLSKLNLEKVRFVNAPFLQDQDENTYKVGTYGTSFIIDPEDVMLVEDMEIHVLSNMIEDTVKIMSEKLETEYLYVYVLFGGLRKYDGNSIITSHRYFTSEKDLKFIIAYAVYYMKQVGKEKNGEIKLDLQSRAIPVNKKESFLAYIKEIGNSVPSEDEIMTWFEKEGIVR